jgi:hypothetical protein
VAIKSAAAASYDSEAFRAALEAYPAPVNLDENTLLYAAPIEGGHVLWQEDVSELNRLNRESEETAEKLKAANRLLAEEEGFKRAIQDENEKTRLMTQLEAEIAVHVIRLNTMIEQLENVTNRPKATARITLLLCYIKRRCNLFFREREAAAFPSGELAVYLDELAEIAGYSGVDVILASDPRDDISVRRATLLYDLFYSVLYWATWLAEARILADLSVGGGVAALRLLPSEDARSFSMDKALLAAIASEGGRYETKELDDDDVSLSLTFQGGGVYAG